MFIEGTEIKADQKNSCFIPIVKQEFLGNQKADVTAMYQNTWLVGTHVMNKYYTVFDQSRGMVQPHFGIALKDPDMDKNRQKEKDKKEKDKKDKEN